MKSDVVTRSAAATIVRLNATAGATGAHHPDHPGQIDLKDSEAQSKVFPLIEAQRHAVPDRGDRSPQFLHG